MEFMHGHRTCGFLLGSAGFSFFLSLSGAFNHSLPNLPVLVLHTEPVLSVRPLSVYTEDTMVNIRKEIKAEECLSHAGQKKYKAIKKRSMKFNRCTEQFMKDT